MLTKAKKRKNSLNPIEADSPAYFAIVTGPLIFLSETFPVRILPNILTVNTVETHV